MPTSGRFSVRYLRLGFIGAMIVCAVSGWACNEKPKPAVAPLAPNDVSWLFPAPTRAEDLANLIAVRDLTAPESARPRQARSGLARCRVQTIC